MGKFAQLNKVTPQAPPPAPVEEPKTETVVDKPTPTPVKNTKPTSAGINVPLYQSTSTPSERDTTLALIHQSLRVKGSEAASYRLSKIEKQRLTVVLHELKMRNLLNPDMLDISSNENEVARIALNYLLNDYQTSKDESILVQVLTSLRT